MRKKWVIAIILPILLGIAYLGTYELAKKSYYASIDKKKNVLIEERFNHAILTTYPFLKLSSNAVISKATSVKEIASDVGFDRYYFANAWRRYLNSDKCPKFSIFYNLEQRFIVSGAYFSVTHSKQNKDIAYSIMRLIRDSKKLSDIHEIVGMDSIIKVANQAERDAYDCLVAINDYANYSHKIYDWKVFSIKEYDLEIYKYEQLKKKPFSLYDYFFNNPLDKEE